MNNCIPTEQGYYWVYTSAAIQKGFRGGLSSPPYWQVLFISPPFDEDDDDPCGVYLGGYIPLDEFVGYIADKLEEPNYEYSSRTKNSGQSSYCTSNVLGSRV